MNNSRILYSFYCKKKKINNIHINTKPTLCLLLYRTLSFNMHHCLFT